MKIVFLDYKTLGKKKDFELFKQYGNFTLFKTSTYKQALKRAKNTDIIIANKINLDENFIKHCPNLKLICLTATGMNNVDLKYAASKNIQVKNVANYSTKSVAQHTFMQVLSILGQSQKYDNFVKKGKWVKSKIFTNLDYPTHDICGKKWGIIGLGSIGKEVAKIAKVFGCKVSYFSTSKNNHDNNYKQVSLKKLLQNNDIISIHCPLNKQTNNLLDEKELSLLKQDAILVNVARGGIVNEKALTNMINNEKIYACIDVLSKEPMAKNCDYLKIDKKDRILFSPHIAWASIESRQRLIKGVENNIQNYLKG